MEPAPSIWSQLHPYGVSSIHMEPAPYRYRASSISIQSQLHIYMEPAPYLYGASSKLIWSQLQIDMEPAPYLYGASSKLTWSQLPYPYGASSIHMEPAPSIWSQLHRYGASSIDMEPAPSIWSQLLTPIL